jgi:hypothetical protein
MKVEWFVVLGWRYEWDVGMGCQIDVGEVGCGEKLRTGF